MNDRKPIFTNFSQMTSVLSEDKYQFAHIITCDVLMF